ncbi:unnamed protein product [Ixodes persulcatus]
MITHKYLSQSAADPRVLSMPMANGFKIHHETLAVLVSVGSPEEWDWYMSQILVKHRVKETKTRCWRHPCVERYEAVRYGYCAIESERTGSAIWWDSCADLRRAAVAILTLHRELQRHMVSCRNLTQCS